MTDPESAAGTGCFVLFRQWLRRQPMWVRHAMVWVTLAGPVALAVAPLLLQILGIRFIASAEHSDRVWPAFSVIGLAFGVLLSFQLANQAKEGESPFKWIVAVVFAPILWASLYHTAARDGSALVAAIALRKETTLNFTVERHQPGTSKFCSNRITFEEFFLAELCNVPDELRRSLRDGQQVVLHGYGTSWGIFVRSIEPLR